MEEKIEKQCLHGPWKQQEKTGTCLEHVNEQILSLFKIDHLGTNCVPCHLQHFLGQSHHLIFINQWFPTGIDFLRRHHLVLS